MKKPILVLYSKSKIGWKSCLEIEKDLLEIYKKNFKKEAIFKNYEGCGAKTAELAKQIQKLCPKHIVFLSHRVHPELVLRALNVLKIQKTSIHFYLYGNWAQFSPEWGRTKESLKLHVTNFIVPSKTLADDVRELFSKKEATITEVPFPVRVEKFRFNPRARDKYRSSLGVNSKEKVILYVGDLRDGKGSILSIEMVSQNFAKNQNIHFWICGSQNKVNPWWWSRRLNKIKAIMGEHFTYFGKVPQSKLADLMSAADLFLLPSRYEFEVFGLTPVEALASGLPCLISNWRGFNEIKIKSSSLNYLEVPPKKADSKINAAKAAKILETALSKIDLSESRTKNFKELQKIYSSKACALKVKSIF